MEPTPSPPQEERMEKETIQLPDGRTLIYYRFRPAGDPPRGRD